MKTKSITLTLVIPAYNESRHLKLCLDAVKAQKVRADEVIVVDNNSTDDTARIAKSYDFVRLVREKRQGIYYARSKGFDMATSKIIGRIDADTILPNEWVARVKDFYAIDSNRAEAWTSAGFFYNIRLPRINGWLQSQITFRFNRILMGHYVLWGSTMALTNDQWRSVSRYTCERTDIHEDLDLAIHLHRLGYKINYDSSMNVAVYMRRVLSDRYKLWSYLQMWPKTLRSHYIKTWIFGWMGALILYTFSPLVVINEHIAQLNELKLFQRLKIS